MLVHQRVIWGDTIWNGLSACAPSGCASKASGVHPAEPEELAAELPAAGAGCQARQPMAVAGWWPVERLSGSQWFGVGIYMTG